MDLCIFWWNLIRVFLYFPHFWCFNASYRSGANSKTITLYILLSFTLSFQTTHLKWEFLFKKMFILLSQFWFLSFCKINSSWKACIVFISFIPIDFVDTFFLWFSSWVFYGFSFLNHIHPLLKKNFFELKKLSLYNKVFSIEDSWDLEWDCPWIKTRR